MKRAKEIQDHGITCSCPRCAGLRLSPQPSMCDWCGKTHAGDANNCEGTYYANVRTEDDVQNSIDWSDDDPAIEEIVKFVEAGVKFTSRTIKEKIDGKIHGNNRASRWEFSWSRLLEKGSSHRGSSARNVRDIGWQELLHSFKQADESKRKR